MSPEETRALLLELTGIFPQLQVDQNRLDVWTRRLESIPAPAVSAALDRILAAGPAFPPNVVQVATEAQALARAAHPDPSRPAPNDAWALVIGWVRARSRDFDGQFHREYPIVSRSLASVGGFPAVRDGKSDDVHRNLQPRFIRAYEAALETDERERVAEPLRPLLEQTAKRLEAPNGE